MSNDKTERKNGKIYYTKDGISGEAHKSWYRGENCNFNPSLANLKEPEAIKKYILKGWLPQEPFISKDTKILAFGSCFAENISNYLVEKGYSISSGSSGEIIDFRAGVNNTFAIRQLFEWVYENKEFSEETWHASDKNKISRSKALRKSTLDVFNKTDLFIITLGLSEVWYNKESGAVFWRAIPEEKFNPKVHAFKVASFSENKKNIKYIYSLIKKNRPNANVVFSLSPVPLVATFRDKSCVTANSVSKSILRSAIDEFYRESEDAGKSLFYWPSYEIVKEYFDSPYKSDNRHVKKDELRIIMEEFESAYTK